MKATRSDNTVIRLALEMDPAEANDLRDMLILATQNKEVSRGEHNAKLLQVLIDAIGRVY